MNQLPALVSIANATLVNLYDLEGFAVSDYDHAMLEETFVLQSVTFIFAAKIETSFLHAVAPHAPGEELRTAIAVHVDNVNDIEEAAR